MPTQTISNQSPAYGGYRHHVGRHHHASAAESASDHESKHRTHESEDESQRSQGSDSGQASGSFARAVFTAFASLSTRNAKPAADATQDTSAQPADGESTQSSNAVLRLKEKLDVKLQTQDGSAVELSLQVKARMNVQGSSTSPNDLMQTMQAFASSIFTALGSLFGPSSAQPAPTQAATPAVTFANSTAASASQSQAAIASLPPVDSSGAAASTPPATSASNDAAGGTASAAGNTATPSTSNVKWIGSYLSISARLRILAQHVQKAGKQDTSAGGDTAKGTTPATSNAVSTLQQQFSAIQQQLQGGQSSGSTSLGDFLHALADEMNGTQSASISFSIAMRGSFVSTSA